jgi:hypothetical protein
MNLVDAGLGPAIYKGVDVTGTEQTAGIVVGEVGTHRYPSGNTHHIWLVKCGGCGTEREVQAQKAMTETKSCRECWSPSQRGNNSPHWKGGEHVPAYFISKVVSKLSRRSRILDYALTLDYLDKLWIEQDGRCAYTRIPLEFGDNATEGTASLDRIDSSEGYIEGNVQFVHKKINRMKWDMSDSEFKNFCVLVAGNL